jgi:hypothetical protein
MFMTATRGIFKLIYNQKHLISCPLVTSQNTCIMAEFGFGGEVMESTFLNQGKNRYSMYFTKVDRQFNFELSSHYREKLSLSSTGN